MNPFQAHDENMAAYEAMCAEPIEDVSAAKANSVDYGGANYPATVGPFQIQQVLVNGGFSPRLMGQVIIRKKNLTAAITFKSGENITAYQIGGSARKCQIEHIEDTFTEYRLTLWDVAEGV